MGTVIKYGLIDVKAKQDSVPFCAQLQPFSHAEDLKGDIARDDEYATLEQGQWLLDGSKLCFPDEPEKESWGLFSSSPSGADGIFPIPVVLEIDFTVTHSSPGLTFQFYGRPPIRMTVTWYGANGAKLDEATFEPDALRYEAQHSVANYKRLVVTFDKALPYHFIKLASIEYGLALSFVQDEVQSCNIHEEVDLVSSTLAANEMEVTLYSEKRDLSIVNPESIIGMLQEDQAIDVYSGGTYYGRFYSENWDSPGEHRVQHADSDQRMEGERQGFLPQEIRRRRLQGRGDVPRGAAQLAQHRGGAGADDLRRRRALG